MTYDVRNREVLATLRPQQVGYYLRRTGWNPERQMLESGADVLQVRVVGGDEKGGTIPLKAAPQIFAGAGELLVYAAASPVSPMPTHKSLPTQAEALREQARFGQTEQGSYVVNVLAPLPTNYDLFSANPVPEGPKPFSRRALRVLMGVLDVQECGALATRRGPGTARSSDTAQQAGDRAFWLLAWLRT